MNGADKVTQYVFESFLRQVEESGIRPDGIDEGTGGIQFSTHDGQHIMVHLDNLIYNFRESGDPSIISDFVARIMEVVNPSIEQGWDDVKERIFISLYPNDAETRSHFASDVTEYFHKFYVLDTPTKMEWIFPHHLEDWGVGIEDIERQALENGKGLLDSIEIEVGDVEGHDLGSFAIDDRNLTAAALFAPNFREKVGKIFGSPVYAVFPDKITCYFFGKKDYEYFVPRIGNLVLERYAGSRYVTPELIEISDSGMKTDCVWGQ